MMDAVTQLSDDMDPRPAAKAMAAAIPGSARNGATGQHTSAQQSI